MEKIFIKNYSELLSICKTDTIILYGIGRMGDFFYSHDYEFLSGFRHIKWVISDRVRQKEHKGYPLVSADVLYPEDRQTVIVTTAEAHHEKICHMLEIKQIQKCYLLTTEYMASRTIEEKNRYLNNRILSIDYEKIPNMGDLLNELIIEKYYGYYLQKSEVYSAQIMGIGSSLASLFTKDKFTKTLGKFVDREYPLQIWGTGFSIEPNYLKIEDLVRNNLDIHALRGNLSKAGLEKILGKQINCAVGDPGLLARELIDKKKIEKKYKIGIIPHYREIGLDIFNKLKSFYRFSKIINLRDKPLKVIYEISACEIILSSSLHGAIVADAFGIPNMLMKVSNIPGGDGFKYRDYYSGYGLDVNLLDLQRKTKIPTEIEIKKQYLISSREVDEKINDLKEVMPEFGIKRR